MRDPDHATRLAEFEKLLAAARQREASAPVAAPRTAPAPDPPQLAAVRAARARATAELTKLQKLLPKERTIMRSKFYGSDPAAIAAFEAGRRLMAEERAAADLSDEARNMILATGGTLEDFLKFRGRYRARWSRQ